MFEFGARGVLCALLVTLPATALAQQKLSCRTGTEDRHARIAMEVVKERVRQFAYYSIWKPKTCSVAATRGDAYTKWTDKGNVTTVALRSGTAVIEHLKAGEIRVTFKDVSRDDYCGLDGEINGTLTLVRGKNECGIEGLMDEPPAAEKQPG